MFSIMLPPGLWSIAAGIPATWAKPGWVFGIYTLLSVTGMLLSTLLVFRGAGYQSGWLCKLRLQPAQKEQGAVADAAAARITDRLNFIDLGVIYFAFQVAVALLWSDMLPSLLVIALAVSVFPFYSIYQQAAVLKKWCPLCMGVIAVLLLQGMLALTHISGFRVSLHDTLPLIAVLSLVSAIWYLTREPVQPSVRRTAAGAAYPAVKRDYQSFLEEYGKIPAADETQIRHLPEIIIGNRYAPVMLTLIANPLCPACRDAYRQIQEILDSGAGLIGLRIIFLVPADEPLDPRTRIARGLYAYYFHNKEDGACRIRSWYDRPDAAQFVYPGNLEDASALRLLASHMQWCLKQSLNTSPLLLINRKRLPMGYGIRELEFFLAAIIAEKNGVAADWWNNAPP